jgi:hypothetical protein
VRISLVIAGPDPAIHVAERQLLRHCERSEANQLGAEELDGFVAYAPRHDRSATRLADVEKFKSLDQRLDVTDPQLNR